MYNENYYCLKSTESCKKYYENLDNQRFEFATTH